MGEESFESKKFTKTRFCPKRNLVGYGGGGDRHGEGCHPHLVPRAIVCSFQANVGELRAENEELRAKLKIQSGLRGEVLCALDTSETGSGLLAVESDESIAQRSQQGSTNLEKSTQLIERREVESQTDEITVTVRLR